MYDFHSPVVVAKLFYVLSRVAKGAFCFPAKGKLNIEPLISHTLFQRGISGSRHVQI